MILMSSAFSAASIYFLLTILFWIGVVVLGWWLFYILVRTAVKNGIIRAAQAGAVMTTSTPKPKSTLVAPTSRISPPRP